MIPGISSFCRFGMEGSGTKPCRDGLMLSTGESCDTQCSPATRDLGGTKTFRCEPGTIVDATLSCGVECPLIESTYWQDGIEPAVKNGCTNGRQLAYGDSCAVQCAEAYKPRGGTKLYSCKKEEFLAPTLSCQANDCVLPPFLPQGVKPAKYGRTVNSCNPGILTRASSSACRK